MTRKRRLLLLSLLVTVVLFSIAMVAATTAMGEEPRPLEPLVVTSGRHDTSRPLREMVAEAAAIDREGEAEEEVGALLRHLSPRLPKVRNGEASGAGSTIVRERPAAVQEMPLPIHNFEGIGNVDGLLPPDTNGDIGYDPDTGAKYYMQWVNVSLAVWDVTSPNNVVLVWGPVDGNALFAGFGGVCEATNHGDPIVLFDHLENRWVAGQFALPNFPNGPFYQCMAVSQTADPSGSWHRYEFEWPVNKMNDYPKLAVWEGAYYMTANQFNAGSLTWSGAGVGAFEKAAMLEGDPAEFVFFDLFAVNAGFGGILPADLDGDPPPDGTPGYFAQWDDSSWLGDPADTLRIWEFDVDWTNSANATFGVSGEPNDVVATAEVDPDMCGFAQNCIPQPGGADVDAISDRLMHRLVYRSREGGTLLANHTVDVDDSDHAGLHWFEARFDGANWSIYQEGVYGPDADHRWLGSVAMDRQGNMALGYSVSSSLTFPSIRYAGRFAADPLNWLTQGEAELVGGSGYQQHSSGRWGDYSMMSVDPLDDCTFWYTQQYYAVTGTASWQTRIGSFRFPGCLEDVGGALAGAVDDGTEPLAGVGINASRSISESYVTTTNGNGVYSMTLPAGRYDVTASKYGYLPSTVFNVEVISGTTATEDFTLAPLQFYTVGGTVTDGETGWPLYAAIAIDGYPGDVIWTDPETGAYSVSLAEGITYTLEASAWVGGYRPGSTIVPDLASESVANIALEADAEACTAPGYALAYAYFEDFEAGDGGYGVSGSETSWEYGTPSSGPGEAHSGDYLWATELDGAYRHGEDGYVTSPAVDVSALGGNDLLLTWWQYYDGEACCDEISVEGSNDGGATWEAIYGPFAGGEIREQVWEQQSVLLDSAYAVHDMQIRFRFTSDDEGAFPGWYVDDVGVGAVAEEEALACVPQAGGLVVGNVYDSNTGEGIDAAAVVNDAGYGTASRGTPQDDAVSEGFYTLFSPSGSHTFTATVPGGDYGVDVDSVSVVLSDTVRRDFDLRAGRLAVAPASFVATLQMGESASVELTLDNAGTRDVAWRVIELDGAPGRAGRMERPEVVVKPFRQGFATTEGLNLPSPPPAEPLVAGDVLGSWTPTDNDNPWGIAFDGGAGSVWVSEGWGDDHVDEYSVAGGATGASWPYSWASLSGPADGTFNWNTGMLWIVNVASGEGNCIFEMDPAGGFTGDSICPSDGEGGFSGSQRGVAYDPSNDTYLAGGWNDMMVYRFTSDGTIVEAVYTGLAIAGLAYNPDTGHLFAMVNDDTTLVYVLDAADGYSVVGQFAIGEGFGPYAGAGLEIDCEGNLWAVDVGADTVYRFDSGEETTVCDREIAWLSAEPVSGTVASGGQRVIAVTMDAGATGVDRPGDYLAHLQIYNDSPYGDFYLPVTMTVVAPDYGVALSADAADQSGRAGSFLTYTLTLTNSGNTVGTFDVVIDEETWDVEGEGPQMMLAPGEAVAFDVFVHIPADARPGEWDGFTVTARSEDDPTAAASVTLYARVFVAGRLYLPVVFRP